MRKLLKAIESTLIFSLLPLLALAMIIECLLYGYDGPHYIMIGYVVYAIVSLLICNKLNKMTLKLKKKRRRVVNKPINSHETPYLRVVR